MLIPPKWRVSNTGVSVGHGIPDMGRTNVQTCFCAARFHPKNRGQLWYRAQILTSPGQFHRSWAAAKGDADLPCSRSWFWASSLRRLRSVALFTGAPAGNVSQRCTHAPLFHLQLWVSGSLTGPPFSVRSSGRWSVQPGAWISTQQAADIFNILGHQYRSKTRPVSSAGRV